MIARAHAAALALAFAAVSCRPAVAPPKPGDPLAGLSPAERDSFDRGRVVFDSVFTPATGSPVPLTTGRGPKGVSARRAVPQHVRGRFFRDRHDE